MGWERCEISDVLATQDNGKLLKQGWSPKCEKHPALADSDWGVLKTTSIQSGSFLAAHNKALPDSLQPRPGLEVAVDDLLLTCAGPRSRCGVPCLVRSTRPRLMISGKMYKMRASPQVLPAFAEAWLLTSEAQKAVDQMKTGGSDSGLNLTQGRFLRLPFLLAPLPEQRRIVAKIESLFARLDEGIAALKRVEANLERHRASVLKAAVEGRLTKQWRRENPPDETGEELLKRILAERRKFWETEQLAKFEAKGRKPPRNWKAEYKEPVGPDTAGLPELPEGWCWATVDQVVVAMMNGYGGRSDAPDGTRRMVLRLADIQHDQISYQSPRYLDCTSQQIAKYKLAERDVLIIRVNGSADLVGRMVDCRGTFADVLFCDHFIRAKCTTTDTAAWLRLCSNTDRFRSHVEGSRVSTAGQYTVSQRGILPFALPLPPEKEVLTILAFVDHLFSQSKPIESALVEGQANASHLRQSILKCAFEGRLVFQNPKDEPASVLLERIQAERETEKRTKRRAAKPKRPGKGQVA